jgi:hypothetical protein
MPASLPSIQTNRPTVVRSSTTRTAAMIVNTVRARGRLRGPRGGFGPETGGSAPPRSGLTGLLPARCLPYTLPLGFWSAIGEPTTVASSASGGPAGVGRAPGRCGNGCAGAPAERDPSSFLRGSCRPSPGERMARVRSSSDTWFLLPFAWHRRYVQPPVSADFSPSFSHGKVRRTRLRSLPETEKQAASLGLWTTSIEGMIVSAPDSWSSCPCISTGSPESSPR